MKSSTAQMLIAARRIADYATEVGAEFGNVEVRPTYEHMGALLADSVLQAGLNYHSVVLPRVAAILELFPEFDRVSALNEMVRRGETSSFLNWKHAEKIGRFDSLVCFMLGTGIEDAADLRASLQDGAFLEAVREVRGVGPKTVDYMACLVGLDSVAVDRHVRTFAKRVGVMEEDYDFLRSVFSYAADLLSVSRREFDAWVWRREASISAPQMSFSF